MINYKELEKIMKQTLSPARFHHSLSVAELAYRLAKIHNWDPLKAKTAGILHDCAKEWSPKKLIGYANKHKLKVPDKKFIIKKAPNLFHAYVGADYAKRKGWVKDREILKAISSHTLGALKMSLGQKVLYIADLSSPDRKFKEAKMVRSMAHLNLDLGYHNAVMVKLSYQLRKSKPIHPFVFDLWNKMVS